jgi:hypothetical protein
VGERRKSYGSWGMKEEPAKMKERGRGEEHHAERMNTFHPLAGG